MADISGTSSTTVTSDLILPSWWIKDPLTPANNLAVTMVHMQPQRQLSVGVFSPKGRSTKVVGSGEIFGEEFEIVVRSLSKTHYNALQTLFRSGRTLLVQSVLDEQWYVRVTGPISRNLLKTNPAPGEVTRIRHAYEISVPMTEVSSP